jgi:hypothetical protein
MGNSLIERGDPRLADLFRRLERVDKLLDELEAPARHTLNGLRFMTDRELSVMLRISRRTLQEYRSTGLLPYYLICGKVLYSETEIRQFLETGRRRSIEEMELL